jgi:hypothetical protein
MIKEEVFDDLLYTFMGINAISSHIGNIARF